MHLFFSKAKAEWAVWKGNDWGLEDTVLNWKKKVDIKQDICGG